MGVVRLASASGFFSLAFSSSNAFLIIAIARPFA
jgi:hypothetical protein